MKSNRPIVVCGGFDDLRARNLRFLEEAARLGELTVLAWPDGTLRQVTGRAPKFPLAERLYLLRAVRYVARAIPLAEPFDPDRLPELDGLAPQAWVDEEADASDARRAYCGRHGLEYCLLPEERMSGFPEPPPTPSPPGRKKVVATGCYDWVHSGHVRFTEEVSAYGDLYVIVGHDANIRLLKGEGHPLIPQEERRYAIGSIRYVKQALISSGEGWLDADPEIRRLSPDIYAVNEDGDRGGKREYCRKLGIEYLVLRHTPAPGLPRRSSTDLPGILKEAPMLKTGILNPQINSLLSRVRHTNTLVIADRGFPFWPTIETVDISLVDDVPTVLAVLRAVRANFQIGKAWMAEEFLKHNTPQARAAFAEALGGVELAHEPHVEFKRRVPQAVGLIRTGDTTQYANIILESA